MTADDAAVATADDAGPGDPPQQPLRFDQLDAANQARIKRNLAKMRSDNRSDAEIADYLGRFEHLAPVGGAGGAPEKPVTPHGASGEWLGPEVGLFEGASRSALKGASWGLSTKPEAYTNAAIDALTGHGWTPKEHLQDIRDRERVFESENAPIAMVSELAGGILPAIATGGGSAAASAGTAAKQFGKTLLRNELTGMGAASASAAINSDGTFGERAGAALDAAPKGALAGLVGTAAAHTVLPIAGAVAGRVASPLTNLLSKGLDRVGEADLPQSVELQLPGRLGSLDFSKQLEALQSTASKTADAIGPRQRAARRLAQVQAQDVNAGGEALPSHYAVPRLGIDELAGSEGTGLIKGILREPGQARADLSQMIKDRELGRQAAVEKFFDDMSGTTRASGDAAVNRLADQRTKLEEEIARVQAANKVSQKVGPRPPQPPAPPPPDAVAAFRRVAGTGDDEGLGALTRMQNERTADANLYYEYAKQVANGPVQSETLDRILQTPSGKRALAWGLQQKANRMRELPKIPGAGDVLPPGAQALLEQARPADRAALMERLQQGMRDKGVNVPTEQDALDPEVLHYMKQHLSDQGQVGRPNYVGGMDATEAQANAALFDKVRSELPSEWREADAVFRQHSQKIDAFNLGRDVMRAKLNPQGTKGAMQRSLYSMDQRVAQMTPEQQGLYRQGARYAIESHLQSGVPNQARLAQSLQNPESEMARRMALATGRPEAAAEFGQAITPAPRPPRPPAPTPPPPQPLPTLGGEPSATARGLDILRHDIAPSGDRPELSLANLNQWKAQLPPNELRQFQEGTAHAVRGDLMARGEKPADVEKTFRWGPQRREQVSHAFQTEPEAQNFQNMAEASEAARKRMRDLGVGSDTKANIAQGEAGLDAVDKVVLGGGSLWKNALKAMNAADRARVNQQIIDIVSKTGGVSRAQQAAALRKYANSVLLRAGIGVTADRVGQP